MRTEVETMKRLKGHKPIVTYIDSHASELRGGGYEVFLLMEYCNGGGLIDFMNTRLQHRLTEPEILNIFSDVAEGVACMHYLKPPLLHRDLKVENVLITTNGSRKKFKLCDFGSASAPKPAPVSVVECRLLDEDLQKHTTLQYRSPEMIDVYRKQPIDEKSDIWALGVLLFKLCYYTTPFEDQGQLAILNASYRFPNHPVFSERLKKLIGQSQRQKPFVSVRRTNDILDSFHVEGEPGFPTQCLPGTARSMCYARQRDAYQGCKCHRCLHLASPVLMCSKIYSEKSRSEVKGNDRVPTSEKPAAVPVVGAVFSPPPKQQQAKPDVVPMRRGRPQATTQPV